MTTMSTTLLLASLIATSPAEDDLARVAAILHESDAKSEQGAAAIEAEIAALDAVPEVFTVLVAGEIPAHGDRAATPIGRATERALCRALAHSSHASVLTFLHSAADGAPDERVREAAIAVLAEAGRGEDVVFLTKLANPPLGEKRVSKGDRSAYREAYARIVERDPRALLSTRSAFDRAEPALIEPLVRAVGSADSEAALRALTGVLGRMPEGDTLLLTEAARVAGFLHPPFDLDVCERARTATKSQDPAVAVAATHLVSVLDDADAIPTLVYHLNHRHQSVRDKSLAALRSITGERISGDSRRWDAWYGAEMAWWETHSNEAFRALLHGEPGDISDQIMKLSRKRLFRHEIAKALLDVLKRDETDLVRLACSALGYLRSWEAVPTLVQSLNDPDSEIGDAALSALRAITGMKLGPDPREWNAALS